MKLLRNDTKRLQGIAILFMLGLHLFNRVDIAGYYDVHFYMDEGIPFLLFISYIFDACVPIYLFCSGYGLYISEEKKASTLKVRCIRILKLLIRFWIVMVLTCLTGFCLGMRDIYPGTLVNFLLNATLIRNSYVGAFWFVQTYVLLVLLSKNIFKVIKKYSVFLVVAFSFMLYIVSFVLYYQDLSAISVEPIRLLASAVMLLLRSQFSFIVGSVFAKEDILNQNKIVQTFCTNKVMVWLLVSITIVIRGAIAQHMIFAPFSAFMLIILLGRYNWKVGGNILSYFGKHSTNMWLVHMQFYGIFTPKLVFGSRNVFIIMLTLVGLSLIASYVIDFIYKSCMMFLEKLKF